MYGYGPFHWLWFIVMIAAVIYPVGRILSRIGFSPLWSIYDAQQTRSLAITGPYSHVRHRQYVGFIRVMFGFLLQRPTILTLAMFPVLTFMYVRLARTQENDAQAAFGDAYDRYAAEVPGFFPKLSQIMGPGTTGYRYG